MGLYNIDNTPITICWEDLYYNVPELKLKGSCTVESRNELRYEWENLKNDVAKKIEVKYPGYIEREKAYIQNFWGLSYEKILTYTNILYGYSYDNLPKNHKDFYEITNTKVKLPIKDDKKPCYITGMVPYDNLTKENIFWFVKKYLKNFYDVDITDIKLVQQLSKEEIIKSWKEELKLQKQCQEMREKGEKFTIRVLPQVLSLYINEKELEQYEKDGLEYGELVGDSEILLSFKDGTFKLINI